MSRTNDSRLGPRQRLLVHGLVSIVAISGIAWIGCALALDPGDFTDPLRVWRHRMLVLHGVSAYGLLWAAGTLFPRHQRSAWQARRNRLSGSLLSGVLLVLALGGLLLYYPPDENWRGAFSLFHQALGFAMVLLLLLHVRFGRSRSALSQRMPRISAITDLNDKKRRWII